MESVRRLFLSGFVFCLWTGTVCFAADIDQCRELLLYGEYEKCITTTAEAIEQGVYGESWHLVKAEAEFKTGKYEESLKTIQSALERYGWSIRLRWLAMQVVPYLNQDELVLKYTEEIAQMVQASPWRYTDAENLVTLGHFVIEQGADVKAAQDAFFTRSRRNNPLHRSPALALGHLALEKRDFQLAAEMFGPALEDHPDDPDITFGLALAFAGSDREVSNGYLQVTLEKNSNHIPALLFQVDHFIDAEQYEEASALIERTLKVNPHHPEALAYQSVIAMLQEETDAWTKARSLALSTWKKNPLVDHTIGRKLSQKYRFEQGATYQEQALEFDPNFTPAKKQLIQDLLRLGREEEGWKLADEVHEKDPYDVAIYNLVTLRDELQKFETLEASGFLIRMSTDEAKIYGNRVVQLLTEAREVLTQKYKQELPETILVEIFPRPADFEVRTFGMPGIVGYLGVCFGDVITANSPASQDANPVNLESVLWHEFAHVVTLNKTNNRMPRWLSEGISVYEERQRDASWGEHLNVTYRKMILGGELAPIGEMSEMFLSPKSPVHVQFAYYQSSLIVEHIIEKYGFDSLLKVLDDLAVGMNINESLPRHTAPLKQLDEELVKYATGLATEYGKNVEWSEPEIAAFIQSSEPAKDALAWADENPKHYLGLKTWGRILVEKGDSKTAIQLYEKAVELFPSEPGPASPLLTLAKLYQEQGEKDKEKQALLKLVKIDDDAVAAFFRLMEIANDEKDWEAVKQFASKLLAVKPLIAQPHAALATASEHLGESEVAIDALDSLLALEPADRADLYYRKAIQQQKLGEHDSARRSTLQALEEAPRYREALVLLQGLVDSND